MHDGTTAQALLENTAPAAGESVLILGASGGMGTVLIQLTGATGARVVAVARGERKTALVRELGADEVVDAAGPDWTEQARKVLGPAGADVVLDGVGGTFGLTAFALLADGGRFSAHGAPAGGFAPVDRDEAARRGVTLLGISEVQPADADYVRHAAAAFAEAAAGRLHPVIGAAHPLERAAEAHAAIEGRALVGKVVLLGG
ncbi:zinc-binding dehydrogenase [Streptomyces sp. NPDC051320]|uniref:zinc-binding dehydrogenase n=1 Tax=Streptomyces sp. NPDC051320 TaxID=3154644 RepID=UPI00342E8F78